MKKTGIAFIGCGFVADYYMATIDAYQELHVVGVYDNNKARLEEFTKYYGLHAYSSVNELLQDDAVIIVLNLTPPRLHYTISKQCLLEGKNVYSEKPLAMDLTEAEDLVKIAKTQKLRISCAPCSVLSKAAKTVSYAVEKKICGEVKLVYAELDDGLLHKMAYKKWSSVSGAPWPYRDEFEVGCTIEHSGYFLTWLMKMFGPVESITAFSDCVIPNKIDLEPRLTPHDTADVSFGILKFSGGVVARLSTTIVAPINHSLRLFGEKGVLSLKDCWDNNSKVYFQKRMQFRRKTFLCPVKQKIKLPYKVEVNKVNMGNTKMDFLLGVQDLADAIQKGRKNQLSADFSLHVTEVVLALQYAGNKGKAYTVINSF